MILKSASLFSDVFHCSSIFLMNYYDCCYKFIDEFLRIGKYSRICTIRSLCALCVLIVIQKLICHKWNRIQFCSTSYLFKNFDSKLEITVIRKIFKMFFFKKKKKKCKKATQVAPFWLISIDFLPLSWKWESPDSFNIFVNLSWHRWV